MSEIYTEFKIFPDKIDAKSIVQGKLGDCYFLSCLAALAQVGPERILRLFKTHEPNAAGCYIMSLCVNGTWQDVIVDDYLPVNQGRLAFGGSKFDEDGKAVIWVSLLEKAWAKLNGNYDRVSMGTVDMGFIHLCGMPSTGLKHELFRSAKD